MTHFDKNKNKRLFVHFVKVWILFPLCSWQVTFNCQDQGNVFFQSNMFVTVTLLPN